MGRDLEEAVWSCYNWGGILRGLFKAFILAEEYNKKWRNLDRPNWNSYIGGEIWRKLFRAFIIEKGYRDTCLELSYRRRDIIRSGGSCLELLYSRRDLKKAIRSSYNWGGISRCLFKAFIFEEKYYKEWKSLFKAIKLAEGAREACLELLY